MTKGRIFRPVLVVSLFVNDGIFGAVHELARFS